MDSDICAAFNKWLERMAALEQENARLREQIAQMREWLKSNYAAARALPLTTVELRAYANGRMVTADDALAQLDALTGTAAATE